MDNVIHTRALSKHFGDFCAVDGLDLAINSGEIYGLLGPNAAGKSTTIRMLSGILQPGSGEASILGYDLIRQPEKIKSQIGYVAQQFALYPDLTVTENLAFYASLYNINEISRVDEQLSVYELKAHANKPAGFLSGGYKRRLAIACATMHDPKLIFLDEPTAGIDPVTRKELWGLFYELASVGKTLFVTTHYMEEAERCHRLAFLNNGRLVVQGTPLEIRQAMSNRHVFSGNIAYSPQLTDNLMMLNDVLLVNQFGSELRIVTKNSLGVEKLQAVINEYDPEASGLTQVAASMEDAFMVFTLGEPS